MKYSPAMKSYAKSFTARSDAPFLHVYRLTSEHRLKRDSYTRNQFWKRATRAARVIREHGLAHGDAHVHCLSGNRMEDLAFRLGAAMTGTVPVTVNWQADDAETVAYKIKLSDARLIIMDENFDVALLDTVPEDPEIPRFHTLELERYPALNERFFYPELQEEDPKIVIFTSGTTGQPKGVVHTYAGYAVNRQTFDQFLGLEQVESFALVAVNPLHHANSTAIGDWCMRNPSAELHLLERYTTDYWRVLTETVEAEDRPVIAPLTARHLDFLEELDQSGRLPIDRQRLVSALDNVIMLTGSAPVGPTTVERLQRYAGRCPTVRFGSTETCLQVMGIPFAMNEASRLSAFRTGWNHRDGEQSGYFIGRPHRPHTNVRVVRSVEPDNAGFLVDCSEGESGLLITKGGNLMSGYLGDADATKAVFANEWYTGLGDVGFYLNDDEDGEPNYYWMSRHGALLIKGGANYAYDQVNHVMRKTLEAIAELPGDAYDLAAVGLRLDSEHEDSVCLTIEPYVSVDAALKQRIEETLNHTPHKACRPDYIRYASVPRNFKGAIQNNRLKEDFQTWLEDQK